MDRYRKDINQETFERIENYLMDRMDATDKHLFEEEMASDELLRNEVNLQQRLFAFVEAGSFLSDQQDGSEPSEATVKKISFRWLYAAAAILAVSLMAWWFQSRSPSTPQQLYAEYFHPDPGLPVVMSSTSEYAFYDGMVSYKEGDYKKAITNWEQLAMKQGYTDTLRYYLGAALINNNESAKAAVMFSALAEDNHSIWKEKAIWFLALIDIKTENVREAEKWLKQLPSDDKAKRLLIDIERISSK